MTLQWQKTGKTTLLVAGTNEQVRAMNQRTILERRVLGLSDGDPSRLATLSDGLKIGAGDRIVSRANDHQVRGPDGHRIENGMAFTVTRIDTDAIACRDAGGRQWTIPRDWAKTNCEAGYATTIHKSQGMTVDRCAAMFPSDARVPCNLQYVAATRGREENHLLYACKDEKTRQTEAMLSGSDTDPEAIARQRMLSTLLTRPDTRTATETRIDEHEERYSLTRLLREHDYAAGLIAGPHLEAKLRQCHNPGIVSMITRSPNWEWLRALWSRAWMTDPKRAMAIVSRDISPKDEHGNRQDPAAVMAGRLSSGLLDRLNGAVRDDRTAGIIPPIKASRNTAALDLVRQNELLITQRADALARQAATGEQPWSRTVMETARKHGDHNLLRDVAIYRDMWHIDDPDQPIGKGQRAGPAGRNSTGATSTHASPDKEAASSTPAKPGRPTVIGRKTRRPAWRRRTPQPWRKGTRNGRHGRNHHRTTRPMGRRNDPDPGLMGHRHPDRPRRHAHGARRRHRPRHHRRRTHQADPVDHRHRHTHPHRRRDRLDHREPIPAHPRARNAPAKPRRPPAPLPEPGHGGTHTTMVTMGKRDTME